MKKPPLFFLILSFSSFAFIPFGGPILKVVPCCNGLMLTIDKYYRFWPGMPPTIHEVGTYLFQKGYSRLIVGTLTPNKWSLGLANPGGVCSVPPKCLPMPTMYTIFFIGTSLPSLNLK